MGFYDEVPLPSELRKMKKKGGKFTLASQSQGKYAGVFSGPGTAVQDVTDFQKTMAAKKAAASPLAKLKRFGKKYGKFAGPVGSIAFIAMPMVLEEGAANKATGAVAGVAGVVGGIAGAKAGAAIGAAIGTAVFPGIGTGIGAVLGFVGGTVGWLAGEEAVWGVRRLTDKVADRGKRMRTQQGWYGDTAVFDTQKAVTMRQASLQMMNQGNMSARSALGHEGVMIHR